MADDIIKKIANECQIFYDSELISAEKIIKNYIDFFNGKFDKNKKNVSFSLHTGSICFDLISILAASLGCITYNLNSADDIIASFKIGDMVIYKNSRYRWQGIKEEKGTKYLLLEEDGKGRNGKGTTYVSYSLNRHLIKPYYGKSKITDSRGIRKKTSNRESFLAWLLNKEPQDIPSELDIAIVIVANRKRFSEIAQNIKIKYNDFKDEIALLDILPSSYYTSNGEEYIIGKNPAKLEPVLKITSKLSEARRLVLNKHGKKVIGLLVMEVNSLIREGSELSDLMRRKNLKFIHVMGPLSSEFSKDILDLYEDAEIFACTKKYLKMNNEELQVENKYTKELNMQVNNIIKADIASISIESGGWSWEELSYLKNIIYKIKQSTWEDKEEFVLSSKALINIFNTAVFTMRDMEIAIQNKIINNAVISPSERLKQLNVLADKSGDVKKSCDYVINTLRKKYDELYHYNEKKIALERYLKEKAGKKIVVIVFKAYHADILNYYYSDNNGVKFVTMNRYDKFKQYDDILIVGYINMKKFDPLQCNASDGVSILLYPCEKKIFSHDKKKLLTLTQKLDNRQGLIEIENDLENEEKNEVEERMIQEYIDLDQYIDSMNLYNLKKYVNSTFKNNGSYTNAEVQIVGTFCTGERIFFSKNYSPILYNPNEGTVIETTPEKIESGDILIFVKRDNYTKNIVDFIYEQLIDRNLLNEEIIKATKMSGYWKKILKEYKDERGLTYSELSKQMKKYGSSIHPVTFRQWLMVDSHVVGPRKEKTLEQIAQLTKNEELLKYKHEYFEACRLVRHQRKDILTLMGKVIADKLTGKKPKDGSILSIIYDNVDNLSETIEIDSVACFEEVVNIPINLVNRPISEMEVLL